MNHEEIERRCLDEARQLVSPTAAGPAYRKRIDSVELEGQFPETRVVLTGEYLYGGEWTIRFPVWDDTHSISPRDDITPNYRRFISYLDIDIREK